MSASAGNAPQPPAASAWPEKWLVASSPQERSGETVAQIMWTVNLALLPTCVAGVVVFGWYAGVIILLAAAAAVASEAAIQKLLGRRVAVADGSAVVTGVLLACCLPPNCRWYVPVVGGFAAIFVGKQLFGGLGRNYFNPALIGRAFLQFAFPAQLSQSAWPIICKTSLFGSLGGSIFKVAAGAPGGPDAMSIATPLAQLKPALSAATSPLAALGEGLHQGGGKLDVIRDLAFGNIPGCIGEVSKLAILLGGLILIANRYVNWRLPLAYVAAALVAIVLLPVRIQTGVEAAGAPLYAWTGIYADQVHWKFVAESLVIHLLSGGLLLGAFFMITDMVTSPTTARGQVIYGIAGGLLVALIRLYGGYPEGVCYSILLVNAGRLIVEKYTVPRVFGTRAKAA